MANNQQPLLADRPASGICKNLSERFWIFLYILTFICFVAGSVLLGVGNNVETCSSSDYNCWDQSCKAAYNYQSYPCTCKNNNGLVFCGVKGPILGLVIAGGVLMGFSFLCLIGFWLYKKYSS